jgi:hypothetical protein
MATEAFALSPISARAAQPSDEDYEAIREAFMETARGRWFLTEYARRNRNADTSMVLDAVARIEQTIAAQRQPPPPPPEDKLPQALAAIRRAVEQADAAALAAFEGLGLDGKAAPIHRGTRIIKEISWRWREIGADGRICDLIDQQVAAIDAASEKLAGVDSRALLAAAFDLIRAALDSLAEGSPAEATVPPRPAPAPPPTEKHSPTVEALQEVFLNGNAEAAAIAEQMKSATTATPDEAGELLPGEEAEAEDEALLEMVALEMAAPDAEANYEVVLDPHAAIEAADATAPFEAEQPAATAFEVEELFAIEPERVASVISEPTPQPVAVTVLPAEPAPAPAPEAPVSLGATILASGILSRPAPANDPLGPIRRMTQAEKIAFFS